MPKRHLRIVKLLGTIPATRTFTFCDRLFTVPLESLKKPADAQWNLDPRDRAAFLNTFVA